MRYGVKILLAALVAALAVAAAAGIAGARRFEVSEQRFLLEFENLGYVESGGEGVECHVTLEGSFHSRTISKVSGALIGYITEAVLGRPCRSSEGWLLNGTERPTGEERTPPTTLPWHLRYVSFRGTLPRITTIRIALVGYSYLEICISSSCLYKATEANPAMLEFELGAEGRIIDMRWDETVRLLKFSGSIVCPSYLTFWGRGRVGRQPEGGEREWREIFVRLVQ